MSGILHDLGLAEFLGPRRSPLPGLHPSHATPGRITISYKSWDFSGIKTFRVTGKLRAQFRAECLTAWNYPNLATPNTNVTNTNFGVITGQDVPRSWQFSLYKVSY